MITYVKGQYVEAYNLLYQEAVDALNKYYAELPEEHPSYGLVVTEADIQNLAQYFHYMRDLTQIDVANNELKFTKLPLDEAHFTIDLNKREITVPDDFKKNGVSVRGDEIAEIVYFEVDRYYDATDLNEQEIIIEWVNANGQKGYSRPYGKDVDLVPGKIIFGWPLSSKITAKEGNVQFAVRFYDAEDTTGASGIVYSLSTLMQTVKINTTIDIHLKDILDKSAEILEDNTLDIIAARATNSKNENGAKPGVPVIYYIGEELGAADGNGTAVPADMARVVYIHTDANNAVGAVTISAGLYADGDGVTTGSFWMKYKYETPEMIREVISEQEYQKLTDAEKAEYDVNYFADHIFIDYAEVSVADAKAEIAARAEDASGIMYYKKEVTAEGKDKFRKVASSTVATMDNNAGPLYRQDYTTTIADVGVYQFVAKVAAGSNEEERRSAYILVFPPVRPKNVHIEGDNMMAKNADGKFIANLSAEMDPFGTVLDEDILPPNFVEYEKNKELYPFDGTQEWPTYKWYLNENVKTPVDELKDEDWAVLAGTAEDLQIEEAEGFYKCGIVGHLNNSASEEIFSAPYRVTMPASEFSLTISGKDAFGRAITAETDKTVTAETAKEVLYGIEYFENEEVKGLTVTPDLINEKYMDNFTYEWYRYVCNKEDSGEYNVDLDDAVKAMQGIYEPDLKGSIAWPADLLQEGANGAEFIPAQDGVYFCVVTNTYNEDTEVVCSPFMAFNYNENK